ncbi:hypothetical protein Tco_0765501 [Tanacetum coccineum]
MRTCSSSNLVGESSPNPTTLNSKCRNRRRSKQPFSLEESTEIRGRSCYYGAKLTHAVNQQTSVVTTAMTAILKQFQATPPLASVKAVEEILLYFAVVLILTISVSRRDGNTFQNLG